MARLFDTKLYALMETRMPRGKSKKTSALRDHMGVSAKTLDASVFPDSAGGCPLDGLVRA